MLVDEPYALCVSCHSDNPAAPEIHHPVQEMYEGTAFVTGLSGVPGAHFSAEDGPNCVTCHMPVQPVEGYTRNSHGFAIVPPAEAEDGQPSTCNQCHTDLTSSDLQYLIDDTQAAVRSRLTINWARLATLNEPETGTAEKESYDQIVAALSFVQNDGSLGVHNYAYADALMDTTERMLSELSVPGAILQPTEAPAPTAAPSGSVTMVSATDVTASSGFRPFTLFIVGFVVLLLATVGFMFLRKPDGEEA
jgi:hypothetical protein